MPAGRPASVRTRWFTRPLDDRARSLLGAAGGGDISAGFWNSLDIFAALYARGYRPDMDIELFLDNLREFNNSNPAPMAND